MTILDVGVQTISMIDEDLGSGSEVITPNVTCPLERVPLRSYEFILPTVTLGALNVAVIVGNSLVILAVFTSAKLRTTTNAFVCSLAVADLLVGLMVLPFSNANEVLRFWVFGPIWCSVWLAVDVWLCTASILNLVAISFDRYVAISRPFKYHHLLSPKRGKVLVGCVWILSFVICFPPLIGWNEQGKGLGNRFNEGDQLGRNRGALNGANATELNSEVWSGSGMGNSDSGEILGFDASAESLYIISSRILTIPNLTTPDISPKHEVGASIASSTTSSSTQKPSPCEGHFPECGLTSDPGYIVYSALGSFWIPAIIMCVFYWKIYRTAVKSTAALKHGMLTTKASNNRSSDPATSITIRVHRGGARRSGGSRSSYPKCQYHCSFDRESTSISDSDMVFVNTHSTNPCNSRNKKYRDPSCGKNGKQKDIRLTASGPQPDFPLLGNHADEGSECYYGPRSKQKRLKGKTSLSSQQSLVTAINEDHNDLNGVGDSHHETKTMAFLRKSRRKNFKLELQKLNKEKKAAKTVGVIVGCFILCWLPFFTVYLIGAFCADCTPPLLFSIFFWLGYCNSAINPCVYALFSRDFRFAFKKLLRCNCRIEPRQKQLGFVTKLHSFRMQASSRSNDSNSD